MIYMYRCPHAAEFRAHLCCPLSIDKIIHLNRCAMPSKPWIILSVDTARQQGSSDADLPAHLEESKDPPAHLDDSQSPVLATSPASPHSYSLHSDPSHSEGTQPTTPSSTTSESDCAGDRERDSVGTSASISAVAQQLVSVPKLSNVLSHSHGLTHYSLTKSVLDYLRASADPEIAGKQPPSKASQCYTLIS